MRYLSVFVFVALDTFSVFAGWREKVQVKVRDAITYGSHVLAEFNESHRGHPPRRGRAGRKLRRLGR